VVQAAVTGSVKDELSQLPTGRGCCRRAEVSALLRFAEGLQVTAGRVVVQAELDSGLVARRLRQQIDELYGHPVGVRVLVAGRPEHPRYLVRVERDGAVLARCTGLIDRAGRPVRGLPATAVTGASCDAAAAWRGAFMAHGSLTGRGRAARLQVSCPGPEAALALAGAARRLGVAAKTKQVGRADLVVVSDGDAIGALLSRLGAAQGALAWQERQKRREAGAPPGSIANLDTANQRRSADAAAAGVAQVQAAMALLAGEAPQHLLAAGRLRLEHPQASLEQLATRTDPPMTKDAFAGRLRRLLNVADRHASSLELPTTQTAVTPELLAATEQ